MSDTPRYALPLLDAAQAQKHVTVNEALSRADVLAAGRVETRGALAAPAAPEDGTGFIVGAGATGIWAGQDDAIALALNGGWAFVPPWRGAAFWVDADGAIASWDGTAWVDGLQAGSSGGAATFGRIVEIDHVLAQAGVSTTAALIPDKAIVLGVSGRVTAGIAGATGWSLGIAGAPTRYGSGYGAGAGSYALGVTGQPQAYYGGTALEITAEGGAFTAGTIRLAVHLLALSAPF